MKVEEEKPADIPVSSSAKPLANEAPTEPEPEYDPDELGPAPSDKEPEYDPGEEDDDLPSFPTTHEIILKDHTKVVTALTLDPSGARVLSGSHDYDCKLWDFGGMDMRCKPFKSWEPAGTYYVGTSLVSFAMSNHLSGTYAGARCQVLE